MDRTQTIVKDIKEQVLLELQQSEFYPESSPGRGFQAYCQLVDAVREEVLLDLKHGNNTPGLSSNKQLVDSVKHEVLRQLRMEAEGQKN